MTQLLQLWKKTNMNPGDNNCRIMAILKNPGDINCRNYGNFEEKKINGSLFITIVAIYGNSEKDTVDS